MEVASKIWRAAAADGESASRLAAELDLPLPLAMVLIARGHADAASAERFLNPRLSDLSDPLILPGMSAAVERIWSAIDRKEPIVIFGDYDADGISSTALMVRVLGSLGAKVVPFLPHRIDDGYGLAAETLQRCIENHHPKLVVTVDCGTNSVEAVLMARSSGIDVIITDHHEPSGEVAPALAVVNPKCGQNDDLKVLSGVGVAFKLCHALVKAARGTGRPEAALDLRNHLDLVCIGTIADIVPLTGENRIFCRHGLALLRRTNLVGLRALIEVSGIKGELDAYHVGFLLGPRLNAVGRLGDAQASLELLLTEDADRARELAQQLDRTNRERQDVEAQIVKEAMAEIDSFFKPEEHFGLVIAREGWHPGVIGIVASRLSARYRRPTVVIAIDETGECRGSCRSVEGFNLVENLALCSTLLIRFGGHAMAAGLGVERRLIEAFRKRFNEVAAEALRTADLRPVQNIDAWVDLREADERLMTGLDRMRPFGFGNPTPVWAARGVRVVGQPRVVGGKHLKMALASGGTQREAIAFGAGDRQLPVGPIDVAFQLQRNSYQGRDTLQFNVQDFRTGGEGEN